jgi:ABC-type transport system substrate-binding protein
VRGPCRRGRQEDGKFDFDTPIEGLRALDRYTVQLRMSEPNYPGVRDLVSFVGAVAREVVEAAGPDLRTRAVGTGPFQLKEWKRGSRLILEANPHYREAHFPASDRKEDADLVQSMKGKRVPFVDRSRSTSSTRTSRDSCCSSRAGSTSCSCGRDRDSVSLRTAR